MSTNPLKTKAAEATVRRSPQDWCDRGNALLAGIEPTTKGEYLHPRRDVQWVVRNNVPTIEWVRKPA